jgi:seryl-tRNA synthetase
MLPIKLFREGPDLIKETLARRKMDVHLVDTIIEKDTAWRGLKNKLDTLRRERNTL